MKTIAIGAVALAAIALTGCCEKCNDEVAVTVNGKALMKSEIDADVAKMLEAQKDRIPAEQMENAKSAFGEQIAQTFVMKALLLGRAAELGMDKISDAELEKRKKEFEEANAGRPGAPKTFEEFAEKYPLGKERAIQELRDGAIIQNMLEKEVSAKIVIDPKKVEEELVRAKKVAEEAVKKGEEAEAKIKKLHKELSAFSGKELETKFAEAAKANSDCPSKSKGGDLGEFAHGQMVPEFDKVAFELEPFKLSEPFKTQFGWHIVMTTKKIPAVEAKGDTPASPEKVQASHILAMTPRVPKTVPTKEQVEKNLKRGDEQTALRTYFEDLRKKAKITAPLYPSILPPAERPAAAAPAKASAAKDAAAKAAKAVAKPVETKPVETKPVEKPAEKK